MSELPSLPVEEEGRLNDPILRENFVERIFAYHRWQRYAHQRKSVRSLVDFHTRINCLFWPIASPTTGSWVGSWPRPNSHPSPRPMNNTAGCSWRTRLPCDRKKHGNVLEHMMGYFSKELSKEEREELLELMNDFRQRLIPLVVPLTLFRHYVRKYRVTYLEIRFISNRAPKN